jgi:2-polyprenyl-3-methyl-5-hydroxy-6-metoxy-1,4-benzoquinol methylase
MSIPELSASVNERFPWQRPWAQEYTEQVHLCPVCANHVSGILFSNLIDNTFFTATGRWKLHQCSNCNTAYLNPRPTKETIYKAYENYYTHKDGERQINIANLSLYRRVRRMLANGYINKRYGTKRYPATERLSLFAELLPIMSAMDSQFRYLPRPIEGQCLLDIGCGNGDFLIRANEMGWKASGLEPDPSAVEVARGRGLQVNRGTIDEIVDLNAHYDAITLSHVVEHVYQPREFLQSVNRLLKKDGIVYIDTPNIQSYGAKIFGSSWRGIEAPRHLTLFNPLSLKNLLLNCGFHDIQFFRRTDVLRGMYISSKKIYETSLTNETINYPEMLVSYLMNYLFVKTNRLEYITLIARKKQN